MDKITSLEKAFEILRFKYHNHSAAAQALSITPCHYRRLRNGHSPIPPARRDHILLKAQEALEQQASQCPKT